MTEVLHFCNEERRCGCFSEVKNNVTGPICISDRTPIAFENTRTLAKCQNLATRIMHGDCINKALARTGHQSYGAAHAIQAPSPEQRAAYGLRTDCNRKNISNLKKKPRSQQVPKKEDTGKKNGPYRS
ncbi:hypothetical protein Trydic_g8854 [Trypoxylus dichotomus]